MAPTTKDCSLLRCHEPRKLLISAKQEGTRAESIHCSKHACRTLEGYPNAIPCRNVALPGAKYCHIHPSCSLKNCNSQRSPTKSFCHNHTCAVENCSNPASSFNRRCDAHKPCLVQGCTRFLLKRPDGQGWYSACSVHVGKRCDFADCPTRVKLTDTYCANHICTIRGCPERRVSGGSNCQNHTCAAKKCPLPVAHPDQVPLNHRTCAYCLVHECKTEGCHAATAITDGHCSTHGCKVEGCTNAKSPDKFLVGYCFSHISEDIYRRAEQAGRNAEFNEAIKRREEEMDQQSENERTQKEYEERIRLAEENETLKLKIQKLQEENASVADHDTTYQQSHWYSADRPWPSSFGSDSPSNRFSHHKRTSGGHGYNVPRNQCYDDDSDTAVPGSTDDISDWSRPATSFRHVPRRRAEF